MLASKNMVDLEEHRGSLYWVVTRTSVAKDANLDVDMITWTQKIEMSLPAPKRRKTESCVWNCSELPSFPVLVNRKALKTHTPSFFASWRRRRRARMRRIEQK